MSSQLLEVEGGEGAAVMPTSLGLETQLLLENCPMSLGQEDAGIVEDDVHKAVYEIESNGSLQ